MRIALDVTPLSRPRTGIGNYFRGMLAGLAEAAEGRHELIAFGPTGPWARTRYRVFVNSAFTRGEVVELLGVPEERVVVAHPGIDPRFQPDGERADLGGPYVLAVGTLEPRKNLPALAAAFALLRKRRPEL